MNATASLAHFYPELALLIGAFAVLLLDLFGVNKKILPAVTLLALAESCYFSKPPEGSLNLFFGYFTLDSITYFFRLLVIATSGVCVLLSSVYKPLPEKWKAEYFALLLFMNFALMLMIGSTNLLAVFLSIEFVSFMSYLLVGFLKQDVRSKEASLKYLLFGSLASGVMLYGLSLLYGASGSLDFLIIQQRLPASEYYGVLSVSLILFLAGLGFKISLAPFHLWTPDAYEAAPTPITAFLTLAPKAVGFGLMIRVIAMLYGDMLAKTQTLLILFSILSMTLGNIVALAQSNVKRLLAYSSIAQAGTMLAGLAMLNESGVTAVFVYFVAYALTNLGIFSVVIAVSNQSGNDDLQSYEGLSRRSPFLAASLAFFLFSLTGLPPLAGFVGKFTIFSSTVESGHFILAFIIAINSAIAAFYYFKIIRLMYFSSATISEKIPCPPAILFSTTVMLTAVLLLGLFPSSLLSWIQSLLIL